MFKLLRYIHFVSIGAIGCLGLYEIPQDTASTRVGLGIVIVIAGVRLLDATETWTVRSDALAFTFILINASRFTVHLPGLTIAESTYHVRPACLLIGLSCLLLPFVKSNRPRDSLVTFLLGISLGITAIAILMSVWLARYYNLDSSAFRATILNLAIICGGFLTWFNFSQVIPVGQFHPLTWVSRTTRCNLRGKVNRGE
jgi:uncharacterized membrane protein